MFMAQYLFNATAIWLISLLAFDLLLGRQAHHARNRAYLLATLLMGLAIPLVSILPGHTEYAALLQRPARTVTAARHALGGNNSIMSANEKGNIPWLLITYLAGAALMLAMLLADVVKLARYHRWGKKHRKDHHTIVETGKPHAPFSFLQTIYVTNLQHYTPTEWQMIRDHELQHGRCLHLADLLLLHLLRIAFWFHPLVHVYNRRLLMVHEYQADAVAADTNTYGNFLIEQTLLHTAPSITHSFHHSPIKNRLRMLTSTSSKASRYRVLLVLPLIPLFITCFAKNEKIRKMASNGGIEFTYPGTKVVLTLAKTDTILIIDPVTGAEVAHYTQVPPAPKTVNGLQIQYADAQGPGAIGELIDNSGERLEEYLVTALRPLLEKLEDGQYFFGPANAVVGTDGYLVYYQLPCISSPGLTQHADPAVTMEIDKRTVGVMENAPKLKPLKVNGKTYPYSLGGFLSVNIREHKIIQPQH